MALRLVTASAFASTVIAAGCAPSLPDLGVAVQWNDAIERLDIYPVYPLQEDLRLGDVLLVHTPSSGRQDMPGFNVRRLDSVDPARVRALVCSTQEGRTRFPAEPVPPVTAAPAAAQRSLATAGRRAGSSGSPCADTPEAERDRLRAMAIPKLTVARVTQAALSGGGVLGNIGANLGIGTSGATALTISLEGLQEMSIPANAAYQLLQEQVPGFVQRTGLQGLFFHVQQAMPGLPRRICEARSENRARAVLREQLVHIVVPTQIIYARTVNFEFARDTVTAFSAIADLTRVFPGAPTLPTTPAAPDARPSSPTPPAANTLAARAEDDAKRIDALLETLGKARQGAPGVQVNFGVGSSGGLTLSQTFPRPMAAGAGNALLFSVLDFMVAAYEPAALRNACAVHGVDNPAIDGVLRELGAQPPEQAASGTARAVRSTLTQRPIAQRRH